MISQHYGKYKWVKILRDAKTYFNEREWDGTTSYLLQSHVEKCREFYVDIENASEHITEQIPNARTRVQILLDSVEGCTDPKNCARVAAISNEASGILADFEKAVAHLLPACPVAVKVAKKIKNASISRLGGNFKAGTFPKTGVELCYHKPPEFANLSNEEREELMDLRPVNKFKGKSGYKGNGRGGKRNSYGNGSSKGKKGYDKRIKGQVAAAIKKQSKEDEVYQEKETKELAELVEMISSTQPAPNYSTTTDGKAATASTAININAIIKRHCKP